MDAPRRWNVIAFLRLNSFGTVRHHQDVALLSFTDRYLSLLPFHRQFQGTKNPAYFTVSRVREIFRSFLQNLLTPGLSTLPSGRCPIGPRDSLWLNAQPGLYRLWRVAFATDIVGQLVADMLMQFLIERARRVSRVCGYSPLILCGGALF